MRPVKLIMQVEIYLLYREKLEREKQLYLMPLYLLFTVKPAPVQTRKMVLYCKASMQS